MGGAAQLVFYGDPQLLGDIWGHFSFIVGVMFVLGMLSPFRADYHDDI
jgi:hypothetical protein